MTNHTFSSLDGPPEVGGIFRYFARACRPIGRRGEIFLSVCDGVKKNGPPNIFLVGTFQCRQIRLIYVAGNLEENYLVVMTLFNLGAWVGGGTFLDPNCLG